MDTHNCGVCGELLSEGPHCTVCNQELHFHCAGITEAGYRKLGDRKSTWRCIKYKETHSIQPPLSPRIESDALILKEIRALSDKLAPLECLKDEVIALRSEFADLKSSLNNTNLALKEFNDKIKDFEQRLVQVEKVQKHANLIQTRLEKLEQESNSAEQWSRMNNVEIKGVPQTSGENLFEYKIGSMIQYPITKTQVNFVTRAPTREREHIKPIIICFCNRYVKEDFVAAARYASKTSHLTSSNLGFVGNNRIYVNDHLTVHNKTLLCKTKKAAVEMNFRYVWVKHAKIHVRKTDTSHIIMVKSERDLSKIV
ncbi:unnamed protein product [Parnassius apollo]|uniref:(apollo) hypothetical protein n=1 Tax=Parnassius apollo TaxID=110799 RepID=A0A8S3XZ05_PARAO|nr:unnamed protein product [Parnassius apollo]